MAKGTTFGAVHSNTDLGLIQQKVEVSPAEPKANYKNVPGANGSKDMTEALGVGVTYEDREIKWTFALYPGADWYTKQAQVSNALNGRTFHIVLDDDSLWYYDGRVTVSSYKSDRLLRQITVKAICRPYKRKLTETTVTRADLTTSYKILNCAVGAMPLVPTITVGQQTALKWGTMETTVAAGTHTLPALRICGTQAIKAKLVSGTDGTISIKWREGSL